MGALSINALSNAWNIFGAPGAILALWAMERYGLRFSLLAGMLTQLTCCAFSYAACAYTLPPASAYALLYIAQAPHKLPPPRPSSGAVRLMAHLPAHPLR